MVRCYTRRRKELRLRKQLEDFRNNDSDAEKSIGAKASSVIGTFFKQCCGRDDALKDANESRQTRKSNFPRPGNY